MKLVIIRTSTNKFQTIGQGFVVDNSGQKLMSFSTLELPYVPDISLKFPYLKLTKKKFSRIPSGDYVVKKRTSLKFDKHFHIQNVIGRDLILIHQGNYYQQTSGCVLVGSEHKYINSDNLLDVTSSVMTMNCLNAILPMEFKLKIIDIC